MPIRDYQSLILPTLSTLADGTEAPLGEIRERIAVSEKLTVEEVSQMLPSGRQTVLANRVSWALLGLERAGLVERVRRAVYRMTDEGGRLLARGVDRVMTNYSLPIPRLPSGRRRSGRGSHESIHRQ